jgi:hypothetical protein
LFLYILNSNDLNSNDLNSNDLNSNDECLRQHRAEI